MPAPSIGGAHTPTDPGTGKVWGSDGAGNAKPVAVIATQAVNQVAHGFTVGQAVRNNGTVYVLSQANTAGNSDVDGVVATVVDADNFTIQSGGYISTLSGLTPGSDYFLSAATPGAITATEPSTAGQVSKPVLHAVTATTAYVQNMRGIVIPSAAVTYIVAKLVNDALGVSTGEGLFGFVVTSDLNGLSLSSVIATCTVAPTGSALNFQVRKNSTDMLSTAVTIDTTKKSSELSATPPVIKSDGSQSVVTGDVVWIDCDVADSNSVSRGSALRLGFS